MTSHSFEKVALSDGIGRTEGGKSDHPFLACSFTTVAVTVTSSLRHRRYARPYMYVRSVYGFKPSTCQI